MSRRRSKGFTGPVSYDLPSGEVGIGVIVPFDFGIDEQYWRYLPQGVVLQFTRTPYLHRDVGIALARDVGRPNVVGRAARALRASDCVVMLYACSSGSFVRGLTGELEIREAMLQNGARSAVTSSGAMLDALRATGARKVAVATPYTSALTQKLVDFLEEAGHDVVSAVHLGLKRNVSAVSRDTIASLLRDAAHPEADAMFLSCTALRTLGIIAAAEEDVGVPIFTSNQVSLWGGLAAAGVLADPERTASGPVLGDAAPVARSTTILLQAARNAVWRAG